MPLLNDADTILVGDLPADTVYLGDMLVWPSTPVTGGWGPPESMLDPAVIPTTTYTGNYTTGARFLCVADGRFTHLRSYNCDTTGTAFLRLYDHTAGQVELARVTVPPALGWNDYPLDPPVPAIAGHEYTVSFYNSVSPTYPYQALQPVSLTPNLIDYDSPHHAGDTYPDTFGGEFYWLDVVYQQAVGGGLYDPDTQRFLDASGLPEGYAAALDGLVRGLKEHGLWQKMNAVYPFAGGTADFHKWNLMDPRDTDDAFRLTFTGGTHSDELGYRANQQGHQIGSPNHADTHLVPLGLMNQDSSHLAYYSLEDTPPGDRGEMGCYNWAGPASRFHIIARYLGVNSFYYGMSENGGDTNVSVPSADGLFVATRTGPTAQAGYHKGVVAQNSAAPSVPLPPVPIWIGAINFFANKSDIPCGFASIGSGLDAQNVADLNRVVSDYRVAIQQKPFSPLDIGGMLFWLDATQVTAADGATMLTWPDSSGYGLDAATTLGTANYRVGAINGHPAIRFGESGHTEMRVNHGRSIGDRTVFQVVRTAGTSIGIYHTTQMQSLDPYMQTYGSPTGTIHTYSNPDLDSGVLWSGARQSITLWSQTFPAGQGLEVDGVQKTAGWSPYASSEPFNVGGHQPGGYALNGFIGEMIVYERCLTPTERADVQAYLQAKWN